MSRVFPHVEISQWLPWTGYRTAGAALEPRRVWATVVSAFFVVIFAAWALASLQRAVNARSVSQAAREEPVAFQPGRLVHDAVTVGYLGR